MDSNYLLDVRDWSCLLLLRKGIVLIVERVKSPIRFVWRDSSSLKVVVRESVTTFLISSEPIGEDNIWEEVPEGIGCIG